MTMPSTLVLFFLLTLLPIADAATAWSYEDPTGPNDWGVSYPICAISEQSRQSPITIYDGDVQKSESLGAFNFDQYDTQQTVEMQNNGHSVVVDLSKVDPPQTISGGGLGNTYRAAQFHFHWGADDLTGSEHLINTRAFPMELHIVHYNTKYASLGEAVNKNDGLAVLGFMFEVGANNPAYQTMVSALPLIKNPGASTNISGVNLQSLMGGTTKYYRYLGSLTTPACFESVTWTVFESAVKISKEQLAQFRTILDDANKEMVDNYRPVQPINGRVVQASFDPKIKWGYLNGKADEWPYYYETCGGQSQSPIDISVRATVEDSIPDFQYYRYDATEGIAMQLSNNGHTVTVAYTAGNVSINGGGLGETYTAAQFHLHWGSSNMRGSEHVIDGRAYPAELHIVHFKTSLGSLGNAVKQPKGLAVLGFFLEISEDDNPALTPLMDALVNVQNPNGSNYVMLTVFSLNSILPSAFQNFYRYDGSLTTPGCFESVIWTVFQEKIQISERQLGQLRAVISSEEQNGVKVALQDNYRPVQPIGTRVVRRNFRLATSWSYEGSTGPANWHLNYPTCSSGGASAQSPINIVDTQATYYNIMPITLLGYRTTQGVSWELSNNGHSVTATLTSGVMAISGGAFSDTYKVAQFHFHWGSSNNRGSEHLINNKEYPMEVHIVHYGQSRGTLQQAVTEPNGLAVLGFMFEISSRDNPVLDPIVSKLSEVRYKGNRTALASFRLRDIIPNSLSDFYRYTGSLTTPGCYESVTWTVFRSTIPISQSQLQQFRNVMSSDKDPVTNLPKPMVNNYRPPQPINGRVVYANFKLDPDAAIGVKASMVVCALCLLLSSLSLSSFL